MFVPNNRGRVGLRCFIKNSRCDKPVNCGECAYFTEVVPVCDWVCVRCVRMTDSVAPFYQEGLCDRCQVASAALMPVSAA